jgi:hypothetical protein
MWCLLQSQSGRATAKQAVTADQGRCRWHPRRLLRPYCSGMGRLRSGVVIWSAGKIGKRSLFWTSSRRMKLAAAWNFLLRTQIFARNSLAVTNLASNSNFSGKYSRRQFLPSQQINHFATNISQFSFYYVQRVPSSS